MAGTLEFLRRLVRGPKPVSAPYRQNGDFYYLGDHTALVRLKSGRLIYVDTLEESVCPHLIARGVWEPWIESVVLQLVQPGDHVLEVGAHVGYYTLGLAAVVGPTGSVTSLEANPRLASLAQRSVSFNGLSHNTTVIQKAASDQVGSLRFATSRRFGGGGHLFVSDEALGADTEVIEVQAIRLDDLDLPSIRLIRIDAEGSEPLILAAAGALLDRPDIRLCIEWDVVQMQSRADPRALIRLLLDKGFHFWRINVTGRLEWIDPAQLTTIAPCDLVVSRSEPVLTGVPPA